MGEYHEFTEEAMATLAPDSVVGAERYTVNLLVRYLMSAGFALRISPHRDGRGFFSAERG